MTQLRDHHCEADMTQLTVESPDKVAFGEIEVGDWFWFWELPSHGAQCVRLLAFKSDDGQAVSVSLKPWKRSFWSNLLVSRIGSVKIITSN